MKQVNQTTCQAISAGNIPVEYIGPDEVYNGVHLYRLPTKQIVCLGPKGICINTEHYDPNSEHSMLINLGETQPSTQLGSFFAIGLFIGAITVLKTMARSS